MQIKLISLLTSCGLKVDDSSLSEVIETHLNEAAHARYRSLRATIGKPRGAPHETPHVPQSQSHALRLSQKGLHVFWERMQPALLAWEC